MSVCHLFSVSSDLLFLFSPCLIERNLLYRCLQEGFVLVLQITHKLFTNFCLFFSQKRSWFLEENVNWKKTEGKL